MQNTLSPKSEIKFIQFLPGITWFIIVLVLICLPGKDVPEPPSWLDFVDFDKIVHGGIFGGIVFLFAMPFKKAAIPQPKKLQLFLKITIATILWGLTTELIQKFFIPGRQYDLLDWAADSLGAFLSFLLCRKIFL